MQCRDSGDSVYGLASKLASAGRTVEEVAARIDLDKALEEKGLTCETQLRLLEAAEKFCGPGEVLSAIDAYGGILEMQARREETKGDFNYQRLKSRACSSNSHPGRPQWAG